MVACTYHKFQIYEEYISTFSGCHMIYTVMVILVCACIFWRRMRYGPTSYKNFYLACIEPRKILKEHHSTFLPNFIFVFFYLHLAVYL